MNRVDVRKQRESFQIPTQRKPRCVGHLPEIVQEIVAEAGTLAPMVPPAADEGPATHQ